MISGLPDDLHIIPGNGLIDGQDGQLFQLGLGYQQAVEGILVQVGQLEDLQGMADLDGQVEEVVQRHAAGYIAGRWLGQDEATAGGLDGDLPGAGGAEVDLAAAIG